MDALIADTFEEWECWDSITCCHIQHCHDERRASFTEELLFSEGSSPRRQKLDFCIPSSHLCHICLQILCLLRLLLYINIVLTCEPTSILSLTAPTDAALKMMATE